MGRLRSLPREPTSCGARSIRYPSADGDWRATLVGFAPLGRLDVEPVLDSPDADVVSTAIRPAWSGSNLLTTYSMVRRTFTRWPRRTESVILSLDNGQCVLNSLWRLTSRGNYGDRHSARRGDRHSRTAGGRRPEHHPAAGTAHDGAPRTTGGRRRRATRVQARLVARAIQRQGGRGSPRRDGQRHQPDSAGPRTALDRSTPPDRDRVHRGHVPVVVRRTLCAGCRSLECTVAAGAWLHRAGLSGHDRPRAHHKAAVDR